MAKKQDDIQTRVRWNNTEKATLIERGRQLMAEGMSPLEALRAAQDALPEARQRKLATISQAEWFVSGLKRRGPAKGGAAAVGGPAPGPAVAAISREDLRDAIVDAFTELFARFAEGVKPAKKRAPRGKSAR